MTVGERIQACRKKAGLSQEELGQRLLVSRQTVSLWETGQTLPTIDNLMRLREIFGISIDELLFSDPQTTAGAQEQPQERYSLQIEPAPWRKRLTAACLLALLQFAVSVAVSLTYLYHSLWGGVYVTLSVLVASTLTVLLCVAKRRTAEGGQYAAELAVYEDRLLLTRRKGTASERTDAFLPDALRDVTESGERIRFRLGWESFLLPRSALRADSRLHAAVASRKRPAFISVLCVLLLLPILSGGAFLLSRGITGNPVRRAARLADVKLPSAEATHVTKPNAYEDDIFVSYRAELYFTDEGVRDFESSLHTDPRWMQTLPHAELADCLPVNDRHHGASRYLLYDRESGTHVTLPQAADVHRYILFCYFEKENMLYIAEFRCAHK